MLNTAPVANDDNATTDEDTPGSVNVLSNDTDPDVGDDLDVTSFGQGQDGLVTCDSETGECTYTPDEDFNGEDSFTYTSSDGKGGEDTATVTVTVNAVNDTPTISVAEGGSCSRTSVSGTMNLTVGDVDTAVGNLTLTGSSSNTTLVLTNNITFGGSGANRTVTIGAAPQKTSKSTDITIAVSDRQGGTATTTIEVTVGTAKNETINGASGADMIFGLNGDDTINAGDGNDLACGGNGNDTLKGQDDNDTLSGELGDDRLDGGNNDDILTGGAGADFFSGGPGTDKANEFTLSQGDTKDDTVEQH